MLTADNPHISTSFWRIDVLVPLLWLVLILAFPLRAAQAPDDRLPLPPGGTSLLPADPLKALGVWGKTDCGTQEIVPVTGQSFSHACRLTTVTEVPNPWELQYGTWIERPITKGDVLLVRFWLRALKGQAETGEAKTKFGMATGGPQWASSMSQSLGISREWKHYSYPFVALSSTPEKGSLIAFDMGFAPQAFEIAEVELISYGNTKTVDQLPRTRTDYPGQEDGAPWRKEAQARIQKIRMGDLKIVVHDATGKPVPQAKVEVRMQRHAFAFGSAVAADTLVAAGPDSDRYRQIILENYSSTPIENHLKWPFWETWGKTDGDRAVNWLHEHDIAMPISGPLVWGGWTNLPKDLESKQADRDYLSKRMNDNIQAQMQAYRGTITEWEVINEPYAQNDLWKIFGYGKMAELFRFARTTSPTAKLYINDYPPLDGAASTNAHLNAYYGYISDLVAAKAPLDGIGFQCHIGSTPIPPERLISGLDRFAKFGLPISITEFDMETTDEDLQRRYMRDFLTAVYSHPSVHALLMWGFWEKKHWLPTAALYRSDWSIKPNGQAWLDLVKRDWWTNADGRSDAKGAFAVRAFYGTYEVTVTAPDGKKQISYPSFLSGSGPITVTLDGRSSTPPAWLSARQQLTHERDQALAAGIDLLGSQEYNFMAEPGTGTSEIITVTGQDFSKATRFTVTKATPAAWNVQALLVTPQPIAAGDHLTIDLSIRCAPGTNNGKVTLNFQTGGPDYTVFQSETLTPNAEWKKIHLAFVAPSARPAGATMLVLQLGHQTQVIDVGGAVARNFGPNDKK